MFDDERKDEEMPFEAVRIGVVSSVDRINLTAKVYFPDRDDTVSFDLKIIPKQSMKTKFYWFPDVDESVICLFLANGQETGFIIGSFYSEVDTVDEEFLTSEDVDGVKFSDGSFIKYDSINHKYIIDIQGSIEIRATEDITIKSNNKIYLN